MSKVAVSIELPEWVLHLKELTQSINNLNANLEKLIPLLNDEQVVEFKPEVEDIIGKITETLEADLARLKNGAANAFI